MPRRGGKRKKTRTHVAKIEEEEQIPKSFVFRRGRVGPLVSNLIDDLRMVMSPHTATKLKERRSNNLKDYVHVAGPLGVTHFLMLSETENNLNFKISRVPRGPTLSFQISSYTLMSQIRGAMRRPIETTKSYLTAPLVVLNNLGGGDAAHLKLLTVTFQNMFPAIDVTKVKLTDCRRVVLLHYDKQTGLLDFRHFAIRAKALGMSKTVKTLVHSKIPNLNKLDDISELILGSNTGGAVTSDSEVDDEATHVTLADDYFGKGNVKHQQSAIRLTELGPRISMKLVKVERGVCDGEILYHAFVTKTKEEIAEAKKRHAERAALKAKRREEQKANVERKKAEKEEKARAKAERKEQREARRNAGEDVSEESESEEEEEDEEEVVDAFSEDDDAEYYREAVGEDPEEELFFKRTGERKRKSEQKTMTKREKRQKVEEAEAQKQQEAEERRKRNRQKKKEKKTTAKSRQSKAKVANKRLAARTI